MWLFLLLASLCRYDPEAARFEDPPADLLALFQKTSAHPECAACARQDAEEDVSVEICYCYCCGCWSNFQSIGLSGITHYHSVFFVSSEHGIFHPLPILLQQRFCSLHYLWNL